MRMKKSPSRWRRGSGTIVVHTPASLLDDSPAAEEDERERPSAFKRKYWKHLGSDFRDRGIRFIAGLIMLIPFAIWFHINNPDFPQNFFKASKQSSMRLTIRCRGKIDFR